MRNALAACCLTLLLVTLAEAVCPIPSAPLPRQPVYVLYAGDVQLTVWRDECVSVLLTPLEESVSVGPLILTQGDDTQETRLVTSYTTFLGQTVPVRLVDPISLPLATVIDTDLEPGPEIALSGEFTITLNGASRVIPAKDSPRGITLIADGCNPCSTGQVAAFHAHLTNPFAPFGATLAAGVILPSGATSAWFSSTGTIPTGATDIPLPEIVVPAGVPSGVYSLEVALFDPAIGTTLARSILRVVKE